MKIKYFLLFLITISQSQSHASTQQKVSLEEEIQTEKQRANQLKNEETAIIRARLKNGSLPYNKKIDDALIEKHKKIQVKDEKNNKSLWLHLNNYISMVRDNNQKGINQEYLYVFLILSASSVLKTQKNILDTLASLFPSDNKELESCVHDIKKALPTIHQETIQYLDDFFNNINQENDNFTNNDNFPLDQAYQELKRDYNKKIVRALDVEFKKLHLESIKIQQNIYSLTPDYIAAKNNELTERSLQDHYAHFINAHITYLTIEVKKNVLVNVANTYPLNMKELQSTINNIKKTLLYMKPQDYDYTILIDELLKTE